MSKEVGVSLIMCHSVLFVSLFDMFFGYHRCHLLVLLRYSSATHLEKDRLTEDKEKNSEHGIEISQMV